MRVPAVAVALCFVAGCAYDGFEPIHQVSDARMDRLLKNAAFPELTPSAKPAPPAHVDTLDDGRRVVHVDMREALRLAVKNNLAFLTAGENLDVKLLALEVLRHGWAPTLGPITGSATYADTTVRNDGTGRETASVGLSQKLITGGSVAANYAHSGAQNALDPSAYNGAFTVSLTQPLLKGGGVRSAVEELVSAERNYVYDQRSQAFRKLSLLIATVETYFGLLQQEQNIRNAERNLERVRSQARQADIREKFGRVTRTDVFRSQLEVTRAEGALAQAREFLNLARDAFKLDLGLAPDLDLELAPDTIHYVPLELAVEEAVKLAFEKNPEWRNTPLRLEDARRALELAANAKLPQVDLTASQTWNTTTEEKLFSDYDTDSRNWSVGVTVTVPIDARKLRRDYQTAVIAYRQAERDFFRAHDRLIAAVQAQMIQLRQAELAMKFQQRAIGDAEKAARLAEFDYKRGQGTNRDVLDAQDRLLEAQNAYEAALVSARITQLKLLQFIGTLEADEDGNWLR